MAARKWASWAAALAVALLALGWALRCPDPPRPGSVAVLPEHPDIVLVTLCSVRADRVSLYDENLDTTPTLAALAAHGLVFDRAYTNSTFTLGAHGAILTGQLPGNTGVVDVHATLARLVPTLPEVAVAHGYRTLGLTAVTSGASLRTGTGLERGFQKFVEDFPAETTASRLAAWLDESDAPALALVHLKQAHSPYGLDLPGPPPAGGPEPVKGVRSDPRIEQLYATLNSGSLSSQAVERMRLDFAAAVQADPALYGSFLALYDGAVRRADDAVGEVIDALREAGRLDRTVVIVVSGHGDGLGEDGVLGHQGSLTDTVLHIPMVMTVPGWTGATRRIAEDVSLVDIMPTVLELIGATPAAVQDGRSLVPAMTGGTLPPRPVISQSLVKGSMPDTYLGQERVTYGPHRLCYQGDPSPWYFELRGADGSWARDDGLDEEMASALVAWRARYAGRGQLDTRRKVLSDEQRRELQRAGYW